MTPPVFLIDPGAAEHDDIVLAGPEGRHAAAVRRLREGERVDLTDGAGLLAECVVTAAGRDTLTLRVRARRHEAAPDPRLVVVQALPKGDRGELAVEMMTEAGVDEIVPWQAARCVTRWRPERREKALGRWRATAREAAKQSRRSRLAVIADLAGTDRVAERIGAADLAVVLHESADVAVSSLAVPATGEMLVVVGPEGGIDDAELGAFAAAGAVTARLGPTVLRTSTAGVAAAAVLFGRCGRW